MLSSRTHTNPDVRQSVSCYFGAPTVTTVLGRRLSGVTSSVGGTYLINYVYIGGTAVAQWLRCCATNRKVAGSIPDGVIGIFH